MDWNDIPLYRPDDPRQQASIEYGLRTTLMPRSSTPDSGGGVIAWMANNQTLVLAAGAGLLALVALGGRR